MRNSRRNLMLVFALLVVAMLALGACGQNNDPVATPAPGTPTPATTPAPGTPTPTPAPGVDTPAAPAVDALAEVFEMEAMFGRTIVNDNPIIPGGTIRWGRQQSTGFPGLFHPQLSGDVADSNIGSILIYALVGTDETFMFTDPYDPTSHAPAQIWIDAENLTATIRMREGVQIFWSDGVELTLDDLLYAYYFISHPDYTGVRFGTANATSLVVGAEDFKAGRVDYIAGLTLSEDERELVINFTSLPPGNMFGGILTTPLPRHHFEGIPVADTGGHINSRDNLLGFGPFILDAIVPGESVRLRANENYWRGRPYADYLIYEIFAPDTAAEASRSGLIDIFENFANADWVDYRDSDNVQFIGRVGAGGWGIQYFMLGAMFRDEDNVMYIVDRYDNHPITVPEFRWAMVYAWDQLTINMTIGNGLARPSTGFLHPFNNLHNIDRTRLGAAVFDLDMSNQLLDEAGFTQWDGDFRLDLDGNPFHVNIAMPHSANNEIVFVHHRDNLRSVGINWTQYQGGWFDHNNIVAHVTSIDENSPNDDMHMFSMGWSMGSNPSPNALWGNDQNFNLGRFTRPEGQQIIENINSMEAWDEVFLAQQYRDWDNFTQEWMPGIPLSWGVTFGMINNRVHGWSVERGMMFREPSTGWQNIGLTRATPYVHGQ